MLNLAQYGQLPLRNNKIGIQGLHEAGSIQSEGPKLFSNTERIYNMVTKKVGIFPVVDQVLFVSNIYGLSRQYDINPAIMMALIPTLFKENREMRKKNHNYGPNPHAIFANHLAGLNALFRIVEERIFEVNDLEGRAACVSDLAPLAAQLGAPGGFISQIRQRLYALAKFPEALIENDDDEGSEVEEPDEVDDGDDDNWDDEGGPYGGDGSPLSASTTSMTTTAAA